MSGPANLSRPAGRTLLPGLERARTSVDPDLRAQLREVTVWLVLVAAGLGLTALAVHLHAEVGSSGAPFTGRYRFKADVGTLLAPAVAVTVFVGIRAGLLERLPWRPLLAVGYLAAVWWALALALVDGGNGLAAPITAPSEYFADVPAVHDSPADFLRTFDTQAGHYSVATRTHPPAPVLLLWAMTKVGLTRPEAIGIAITLIGCLSVPLLAVAVRSLCHEPAARQLLPVLALAPYAVWLAVSLDAVTLALAAAFVALGVVASERERPRASAFAWAFGSGLVLGVAALMNYAVAWLGVSVVAVYFVRRRPLLNVMTGLGALVPITLAWAAGFTWLRGLSLAQADFSVRVGPHRSWLLWAFLDVLLLLLAAGPAVVRAARRVRTTPGWPFLVGAGLAVIFAVASGLSRGEVERSWLPFYPFLLVPAVAPAVRPAAGEPDAAPAPMLLIAPGAAAAVIIEALLRTTW